MKIKLRDKQSMRPDSIPYRMWNSADGRKESDVPLFLIDCLEHLRIGECFGANVWYKHSSEYICVSWRLITMQHIQSHFTIEQLRKQLISLIAGWQTTTHSTSQLIYTHLTIQCYRYIAGSSLKMWDFIRMYDIKYLYIYFAWAYAYAILIQITIFTSHMTDTRIHTCVTRLSNAIVTQHKNDDRETETGESKKPAHSHEFLSWNWRSL